MKKKIAGFIITLVLLIVSSSYAIMTTIGSQVQCDTNNVGCNLIPLQITTLCTVSCPLAGRISPSHINPTTRMWGSRDNAINACRTSIDGGITWANCTSNAFADTGGGEVFAEASDGSVIAVGRTAANTTCLISRSINNATSWSSVFTLVPGGSCAMGTGEGQKLFCLSDGRCEWILAQSTLAIIFRSNNNGVTWSSETLAGSPSVVGSATIWNGSQGISPSGTTIASTRIPTSTSSDSYSISGTAWGGTQGDCWGAVIYNAVPYAVCQGVGAAPDGRYTLRIGDTGANFASLTLPNALITLIDAGGIAYGYATNTLYIAATTISSTYGLYISRDNLSTFVQVGNLTAVGAGLRGGAMFNANGCIYISYGQTTSAFAKVC